VVKALDCGQEISSSSLGDNLEKIIGKKHHATLGAQGWKE
jgi:hypothetical protein